MRKLFFILPFIVLCSATYAQNYQLHPVYIYSFIRYVQWPDHESSKDFVIGVIGDSPILPHLEKMAAAKKAGSRTIVIKKFTTVGDVSDCQIVFLAKEKGDQLSTLMERFDRKNTLLVTEQEGMGSKGSNINFVIRDGKLAFELNKATIERSNLKVSTELARLAIII